MTLIDRLSKLERPDREVDALIYIQFNIPAERAGRIDYANGMVGWWPKDGPYVSAVTVPAFTASVDEAIALAERVLPGWNGDLDIGKPLADSGKMGCRIWTHESKYHNYVGEGFNSATALLIAILRAKEAGHGE